MAKGNWTMGKGGSTGVPKKERSVRFTYKVSVVALILVTIEFIVMVCLGNVSLADYCLLAAGIFSFSVMKFLWEREKKEKMVD